MFLKRKYYEDGINGQIFIDDKLICKTIELPWRENQRRISAIPEGRYELKKRVSQKFGNHLILIDVPNRSLILIHPANDALKELNGCIAPVTTITGIGKGSESRKAFLTVRGLVHGEFEKGNRVFLNIVKDEGFE